MPLPLAEGTCGSQRHRVVRGRRGRTQKGLKQPRRLRLSSVCTVRSKQATEAQEYAEKDPRVRESTMRLSTAAKAA